MIGARDPLVLKILNGKSPQDRAAELVRGSKLAQVDLRNRLADGLQKPSNNRPIP